MQKFAVHRGRLAAGLVAATTVLSGCSAAAHTEPVPAVACSSGSAATCPAPQNTAVDVQQARALLDTLPVKTRAPQAGYSREQFGEAWSDNVDVEFGHNRCETRDDILRRDFVDVVAKPGTHDCTVASGTLHDIYTGKTINFVRGPKTSTDVQIDRVVALSAAWQTGAQQLSPEQRRNLANDPRNLQAVDGPTNQSKSDSDAAQWPPPATSYHCTYVSWQIEVKSVYSLWVTQAEKDAMNTVLRTC